MQMKGHLHALAGPLTGKEPPVGGYLGAGAGLKAASAEIRIPSSRSSSAVQPVA
jgi:hypothetical protein